MTTQTQAPKTRRKFKFSDDSLAAVTARRAPVEYTDSGCPGLYVRVQPSGIKTLFVRYRVYDNEAERSGPQERRRLGRWPGYELGDARAEAMRAVTLAQGGKGPYEDDTAAVNGLPGTIRELVEAFLIDSKNAANQRAMLRDEIVKPFGHLPVESLTRQRLKPRFDELAKDRETHPRGKKLATYVTRLFSWTNATYEKRLLNPAGNLDIRWQQARKRRAFRDDQLKQVWAAALTLGYQVGHIARLMMLTGQRPEVWAQARWTWWQSDGLHIPEWMDKDTKKYPRFLPLTPAVEEIIEDCRQYQRGPNDLIFHTSARQPMKIRSAELMALCPEVKPDNETELLDLYSCRHSAETNMRRKQIRAEVIDEIQGHARQGEGHARYNDYKYSQEKLEALLALEKFTLEVVDASSGG